MKIYKIQLQETLKEAGLYDGVVDGIVGRETVRSVNELVKRAELNADLKAGDVTKNFTIAELIRSNTATALNLNNNPTTKHRQNLIESAKNLWQPVRDMLNAPMIISSGYRSKELNRAVGGSRTSAHSYGYAIDFTAPEFGDTRKIASFLAKELASKSIKFDQLILEFPNTSRSWIHLGYKNGKGDQRGQLLTAVKKGGRTVYIKGLK